MSIQGRNLLNAKPVYVKFWFAFFSFLEVRYRVDVISKNAVKFDRFVICSNPHIGIQEFIISQIMKWTHISVKSEHIFMSNMKFLIQKRSSHFWQVKINSIHQIMEML